MESEPSSQTLYFPGGPSWSSSVLCPLERVSKDGCPDRWRSPTKWLCWWIVVCFMCSHEVTYVESHVCVKTSCLDDDLVRMSVLLGPFHWNTPISPDKRCRRRIVLVNNSQSSCERKCTCLVRCLYTVIGHLISIFKVCVSVYYMLCETTQRSCRHRSPWAYL
jgi:hypothetical protein